MRTSVACTHASLLSQAWKLAGDFALHSQFIHEPRTNAGALLLACQMKSTLVAGAANIRFVWHPGHAVTMNCNPATPMVRPLDSSAISVEVAHHNVLDVLAHILVVNNVPDAKVL